MISTGYFAIFTQNNVMNGWKRSKAHEKSSTCLQVFHLLQKYINLITLYIQTQSISKLKSLPLLKDEELNSIIREIQQYKTRTGASFHITYIPCFSEKIKPLKPENVQRVYTWFKAIGISQDQLQKYMKKCPSIFETPIWAELSARDRPRQRPRPVIDTIAIDSMSRQLENFNREEILLNGIINSPLSTHQETLAAVRRLKHIEDWKRRHSSAETCYKPSSETVKGWETIIKDVEEAVSDFDIGKLLNLARDNKTFDEILEIVQKIRPGLKN